MHQAWKRKAVALTLAAATAATGSVLAATSSARADDSPLGDLRLDSPIDGATLDPGLRSRSGTVDVSIRLATPSVSRGGSAAAIAAEQAGVVGAVQAAGGTVRGTVDTVLNAVFATVDASAIDAIVAAGPVTSVNEVADYELALDETVPYIGATPEVQAAADGGAGITVAVLDSGVDYTHAALGGAGTLDAYEAAHGVNCGFLASGLIGCDDPNYAEADGFPTDKVIGGYDFVGEEWPIGDVSMDPDPIDWEGHGTHVADIIAGELGVAPAASILAYKVCSAVGSSCEGVALILAMEAAVDDGADIINMSLGSIYGQAFDDDLSQAVDGATAAGVLTVASAGNSGNKPYTTGTPAAAPTALSVAQTQVPSARLPFLTVIDGAGEEAASIKAVFQDWSAMPDGIVEGGLQYADGSGGNANGCAPFAPDSLTGLVVLVDRGACSFTAKIANIANAGGIVGIIGLVAPGDPFTGGYDGVACDPDGDGELNCDDIPGYMISQADSNLLKTAAAEGSSILIDPALGEDLVGSIVGSSARGPGISYDNLLKPEIGAPGASISAEAGTGTDTTPFGGTSGAAPMVSGAAALVLADDPSLTPAQVKALLVNSGETDIETEPGSGPAPITRIGGGEVRVDRAIATDAAAWVDDDNGPTPVLSFGFVDVATSWTETKTVTIENYGGTDITYDVVPSFRYANDQGMGVTPSVSDTSVVVPAGGSATVDVTLTIDAAGLHDWLGNSGAGGADPSWLDVNEYDGYVDLVSGDGNDIHLPWHVLPRKSTDIEVEGGNGNRFTIENAGANDASLEAYHLLFESDDLPEGPEGGQAPTPDFRAAGVSFYDGALAGCASDVLAVFAVNTWEPQVTANAPALFEFDVDVDGDGTADYAIYNADLSILTAYNLSDGQNVVVVQNLENDGVSVYFYVDHETNSANTRLYVCGEQIDLDSKSLKKNSPGIGFAADIYFGGPGDVETFRLQAGTYQAPLTADGAPTQDIAVPAGESVDTRLIADANGNGALVLVRGGEADGEEAFVLRNGK